MNYFKEAYPETDFLKHPNSTLIQSQNVNKIIPTKLNLSNAGEHLIHNLKKARLKGRGVFLSSIVNKKSSFPKSFIEKLSPEDFHGREIGYVYISNSLVRLTIWPIWENNYKGILRSFTKINHSGNFGFIVRNNDNGTLIRYEFYDNLRLRNNVYNYIMSRKSNVVFTYK